MKKRNPVIQEGLRIKRKESGGGGGGGENGNQAGGWSLTHGSHYLGPGLFLPPVGGTDQEPFLLPAPGP